MLIYNEAKLAIQAATLLKITKKLNEEQDASGILRLLCSHIPEFERYKNGNSKEQSALISKYILARNSANNNEPSAKKDMTEYLKQLQMFLG